MIKTVRKNMKGFLQKIKKCRSMSRGNDLLLYSDKVLSKGTLVLNEFITIEALMTHGLLLRDFNEILPLHFSASRDGCCFCAQFVEYTGKLWYYERKI